MKKKILTMALAACMGIAGAGMLVGCGHEHTFAEEWKKDITHHWHEATCEHTTEKDAYSQHDYTDAADISCNTCGFIRETATYNLWDGSKANSLVVDGTIVTINTAEELAKLAYDVNEGNSYAGYTINLECDIDLQNLAWDTIGYGTPQFERYFQGTFDGKNHTIYNLNVVGAKGGVTPNAQTGVEEPSTGVDGSAGVGLFGSIHTGAVVKNVKIENAVVTGNHYVGAVVGYSIGGEITNCHVKNAVITCSLYDEQENGDKAGVVSGSIDHNSTMTNCSATDSSVTASRDAGQVVGCASITRENFAAAGNTASNVTVTHNGTGTGANIENQLIGRLSGV